VLEDQVVLEDLVVMVAKVVPEVLALVREGC
jgi:hypothetical protein